MIVTAGGNSETHFEVSAKMNYKGHHQNNKEQRVIAVLHYKLLVSITRHRSIRIGGERSSNSFRIKRPSGRSMGFHFHVDQHTTNQQNKPTLLLSFPLFSLRQKHRPMYHQHLHTWVVEILTDHQLLKI